MSELTERETRVLEKLSYGAGEWFWPFGPIEADTGLSRDDVRSACRALRAKGLAEFMRGLWSEDGEPAGSGYGITEEGQRAWRLIEARREFPVGAPVRYWPMMGNDEHVEAEIRSEPWECSGQVVVAISGKAGGVSVRHLERREAAKAD